MSNPTEAHTHAGHASAKVNVNNQNYTFNMTDVTTNHTSTEWRYTATQFSFQPPPSGVYMLYIAIPHGTPAGTYELEKDGDIRAFYDMPGAYGTSGYRAISGSIHFKSAPTVTKVDAEFHFVGQSVAYPGDAIVTDGNLSVDTETHHTPKSQGYVELNVDINSYPSTESEENSPLADKFLFHSELVRMGPALGAPFLEVKSIYLRENSDVYIFIPEKKLVSASELDIKDDESGEYAIAILRKNWYWYRASSGHISYKYDRGAQRLTAKFKFDEGKDNKFRDGHLKISGLSKAK